MWRQGFAHNGKRFLESLRSEIFRPTRLCFDHRFRDRWGKRIPGRNYARITSTWCRRMKILVRATNWVGDAIMALPALRAIRNRSDIKIAILARPYVAEIYRDQDLADELILYDVSGRHA